jgi:signal transduction histidine kinase
MSGPEGRWSVTARDVLLAALAGAAILAVGLAGAGRSRELPIARRATADRAVLAQVATGVAVDLEHLLGVVAGSARDATGPTAAPVPGFVDVDSGATLQSEPALSAVDRTIPGVAAILDRARDSGEAVLSEPIDLGDGPRPLLVAAAYARDPNVGRPQTTVDRRARLRGWVVEPVDLGALAAAHLQEGAVASVRDGDSVSLATATAPPAGLPEQAVEVQGRELTIRAGDPSEVSSGASTIAIMVAAALLGIGAAAAVILTARRLREQARQARDRSAQVRLIGDVAPLVQRSLELADVLPAVAVQLSDHFGLAGVALSTGTSSAEQVELFSIGQAPAAGAKSVLRPPSHLAEGETLALALQRGGRSVALLQLVAGRDLDEAELQSLRALTELVAAAVVNASLYASQQEALRRLRELDALKTVFLGTASHELRTPATAIGGFASLLTANWDRFDEAQRRDFVSRIGANARSLSAVVQDLLDFSLLDKGTLAVTIRPIDLGALVGSVVDRLGPMFTTHTIEFAATPASPVAGDVNGLERIVTNLLTNAVKFSPTGTTVHVSAGPAEDGYGAQVVISDEGPGIPAVERQQVFTRFFRGTGDAVVQTRGVGIGLSVVAEFVARLRGDIVIDDAPGGGARFTIRFPASSAELLAKEAIHAPTT